ncbi:MAG: PAS domain S-box protein [Polaromonas sp.]|nr:PAS domain S-box protein [Polaromonas sp.]
MSNPTLDSLDAHMGNNTPPPQAAQLAHPSASTLPQRPQIMAHDQGYDSTIDDLAGQSQQAQREILQNLRVHQIELEMQNEELRRTQSALYTAEARYFDLYDLAPVGYATVSDGALILQANLTTASLLGVPRADLIGKPLTRFMPATDADRYYLFSRQALIGSNVQSCELCLQQSNGDVLWVSLQAIAFTGDEGTAVIRMVLSDITGRRQLEQAAKAASEDRFRLVADNTSDGIVIFGADRRIQYVSPAYVKQLGYSEAEERNRSLDQIYARIHPEDRDALFAQIEQAIAANASDLLYSYRVQHRLGHTIWREDNARFQYDGAGNYAGACVVARDITERKLAEAQMQEMNLNLIQSRQQLRNLVALNETTLEKEKRHIAREVHDELGQILTALRMDLSLAIIRHADHVPDLLDALNGMKMLVDRAVEGVRNVATSLRPAALDMGLVTALEWLCLEFTKHGAVECALHGFDEGIAIDDARAVVIFRIVQEALTNIRKYAQASQVDIMLERRAAELSLEVRDNGLGFDPVAVAQRGTLGLLGMRERVIALGGRFEVVSTPGQGTVIALLIPLAPEVAKAPA